MFSPSSEPMPFARFSLRRTDDLTAESPSSGRNSQFHGKCAIGAFSYVGPGSTFHQTSIGRYCSIAANVTCGPTQHPTDRFTTHLIGMGGFGPFRKSAEYAQLRQVRPLPRNKLGNRIGNDVWIGANAVIMRGVTIGDGAVIGAGAVITRDVPPYAVMAGVPAKQLRLRFDAETVRRLQATRWWDYDLRSPRIPDLLRCDVGDFLAGFETLVSSGDLHELRPRTVHFTASPFDNLVLRALYFLRGI